MTSSNSQTQKNQSLNMGDVLAKESEQTKAAVEEETWDNREDADGASSAEDSIIRDLQERLSLTVGASDDNYESDDSGTQCDCDACQESIISVRNPHFDQIQEHWQHLRLFIQIVYKQAVDGNELDPEYTKEIQPIIHELVTMEPHLLYKQLEGQIQEWVIETELRQLESLLITDNVDTIPHRFISGLLESYKNLMLGAELAFPLLEELQKSHLSKFNMTWRLLNEHIYQSCVYVDPLVQNNVPIFIGKLSNCSETIECNRELVKEFLYLDDSINSVAEQWVLCKRELEAYSEDEVLVQGRRSLLEMEWRCFKAEENSKNSENSLKNKVSCKKVLKSAADSNSSQISNKKCDSSSCDCMKMGETHHFRSLSPSSLAACRQPNATPSAASTANIVNTNSEVSNSQLSHSDIDERVMPPSNQAPVSRVNPPLSHVPHSHSHPHVNPSSGVKPTGATCNKPVNKSNKMEETGIVPPTKCRGKTAQLHSNCMPRTSCHKNRAGCSHHKHETIKRVPHRANAHDEDDSDTCSSCTPPDDSASDRSSVSNQKSDPRHCDCCYCEVFGHGVPSGAPVSRNYQEIRERLRLLLNKKKNSNKKQVAAAATPAVTSDPVAAQHRSLPSVNQLPATIIQQAPPEQPSPAYKGNETLSDILNFIEGKTSKDSKKAAKKARQKEKKLQEMYEKKLEEEAAERAKLEAEKKRKQELLLEKERLIKEQQRLERELQKQNQILNKNLKALSVKNNNNESNINNNSKKGKKGKQQQQQQQNNKKQQQTNQQQQQDVANSKKNKKKNKKGGDNSPPAQNDSRGDVPKMVNLKRVIEPSGEGEKPKIVTIKRVMESSGNEPTVTITLRGATPSQDKVLYTLQNSHGPTKNAHAAPVNNSHSKATHVQHTPGVVEINVNGGPGKAGTVSLPSGQLTKNPSKGATVTMRPAQGGEQLAVAARLPCGGVGMTPSPGFSSMSVMNASKSGGASIPPPPPSRNNPSLPPPQLTSSTAIQISNAISSLTSSGGSDFKIEDLQLPPGITITKVVPPSLVNGNSEDTSASSSLSCDGGDLDHLNKENTNLNGNAEASVSKKSRKKRNKQRQQQLLQQQQQQNGDMSLSCNVAGQSDPDAAIFKMKGSMVTIRNPSVFPEAQSQHGASKRKDLNEWNLVDEESVFAPKDIDLDNGDIDDAERELEAFKRFCSQSVPPKQKEKVHLNIKDIVLKKKRSAISCS